MNYPQRGFQVFSLLLTRNTYSSNKKEYNTCLLPCQPSHGISPAAPTTVKQGVQIALITWPHLLPSILNFSEISTAFKTQQNCYFSAFHGTWWGLSAEEKEPSCCYNQLLLLPSASQVRHGRKVWSS